MSAAAWDAGEADLAFAQLAQALSRRPPRTLNLPPEQFRASAVVAPFRLHAGVPNLVFTQRPDHLRHHAGQISFPGGAREPDDGTAMFTAVRELQEELGVPAAQVEILGALDELPTPSGFRVAPFVGRLAEDTLLQPNPAEVAAVLELPVAGFFAKGLPRIEQRSVLGRGVEVYYYDVNGYTVWGVTGHIVRGLFEELARLPAWARWTRGF